MALEGAIPTFNWAQIWFWAQILVIILFFVLILIVVLYLFSYRLRGLIIRRRAGGVLKGFRTWGKYVRKEAGKLNQIKLIRRRKLERKPPQTAMINLGRKDFIMWLEDDAGDLKPFKVNIERAVVKKAIQAAIKKARDNNHLIMMLVNHFCPSLSVDDVDMRFWKVQQDKATEEAYKKVEKWKDILYIGGFVIMVVMFVIGMVLMKSVC